MSNPYFILVLGFAVMVGIPWLAWKLLRTRFPNERRTVLLSAGAIEVAIAGAVLLIAGRWLGVLFVLSGVGNLVLQRSLWLSRQQASQPPAA
jgi:hypothetical protein